jgi:iron-sulfur cluster assembly protein
MDATLSDPIDVTEAAARKVRQLAEKEGRLSPVLRLRVVAGGCSGFSYELTFVDEADAADHVIEATEGVRIVVDPTTAPIVRGSTLDLDTSLLGGGLRVRNPQAVHECACGESFSV